MNKKVMGIILAACLGVMFLAGCEVQSTPVKKDPGLSDIEAKVGVFANSIDPYEKYSRNEVYAMLEEFMHENPDVYATGFAVAGAMNNLGDFYYIYKDGTTYITMDGFDYWAVDKEVFKSLQEQVAAGEQFWSNKYVREDGSGNKITVSTFFTPILDENGKAVYVLTVDQIEESK